MEARRVLLLISGVRVGRTSVGTTVSPEGILRCWKESDFFTLIEPIARTSQQWTGSTWLRMFRRKRA